MPAASTLKKMPRFLGFFAKKVSNLVVGPLRSQASVADKAGEPATLSLFRKERGGARTAPLVVGH